MFYMLLPMIVYIPVGIYLYFFFKRFLTLFNLDKKSRKSRLISAAASVLCAAWGWMLYGFGAVAVLHFTLFSLLMEILNAVLKYMIKSYKMKKVWSFFYRSGLVSVAAILILMGYGYYNIKQVHRTEYIVETDKTTGGDLKIIQISDLHMGTTMNLQKLNEYCSIIRTENPDILALTGDIFDERTSKADMEGAVKALSEIKTRYGIYYVFGNHDYNYYTNAPNYTADELRNILAENGIMVLEDAAVHVRDNLVIAGRKDAGSGRQPVSELLAGTDKSAFILLLDHQPKGVQENAVSGVDLQLSGHTHAGQIWPTGQLGELSGAVELNYGIRKIGNYNVIVSSGIAGWGYPIRTGGHSEYVVITVKNR